jgi:hypothetical protein
MKSFAALRETWPLLGFCVGFAVAAGVAPAPQQKPATGPFATKAKVTVWTGDKVIPLKREEQIAFMFVSAIQSLESNCDLFEAAEPCTLEALIRSPQSGDPNHSVGKLKFDPNATDPNYTYKVVLGGRRDEWQAWANPRKPGLGGFYMSVHKFSSGTWYNPAGPATEKDKEIGPTQIDGDAFN